MNVLYYNGLKKNDRKFISAYNTSFLYGINCFEGLRLYYVQDEILILDLDNHLRRLYDSLSRLNLSSNISMESVESEILEIVKSEDIRENCYLRITFFLDDEVSWSYRGNVSRLISIRSMSSSILDTNYLTTKSLGISKYDRITMKSMPPNVKAGANYLNSRYATLDVKDRGFDLPLMLNKDGFLTESAGSCLFFFKNNCLYTPSEDMDILHSITRKRILEICRKNSISCYEGAFKTVELEDAEVVFLAGTMMEITEVHQIEKYTYKTGGYLIGRIRKLYLESIIRDKNELYSNNK